MTSKEALEILVKQANERKLSNKIVANGIAVSLLEKLVERDTPKKVEIGTSKHWKGPICPNCKDELNEYYKDKYCSECGQRLDWSEKENDI